ncbi:hypothetical protein EWV32_16755 [Bacillus thuringiensis]|nr:hypothetical protein EWV32_16755 [Bacillus thuringiensis]QFP89091.1 hypothetical protein F9800_18980 [Bacillus thuringiensis]
MGSLLRKKIYKKYRSILGSTHMAIQIRNTNISKTRECTSSCENVHSLVLRCYKILKLMDVGYHTPKRKLYV